MGDLAGQKIVITGAGRGLGRAMAEYCGAAGMIVGVVDIDAGTANEVSAAIEAAGGTAEGYAADVGDRASFADLMADFAGKHGSVDALVNNAMVLVYEPIEDVTEDTLDRMLSAGFKAMFWGTQAFLAHHAEGTPGTIVNMTSPVAYRGRARTSAYSAIKGAVASFTMVMAGELGPRGIRVNAMAPGSVPTPATAGFVSEEEYARRRAAIPLRRLGEMDDVANALGFLLSDKASFVNGAMLAVDGGIIAAG